MIYFYYKVEYVVMSAKISFICKTCLPIIRSSELNDSQFSRYAELPSFGQLCCVEYTSMCPHFELCLFVLMAWICSSFRILNVRPICPIYLNGHSENLVVPGIELGPPEL
jgi:hypothetical protein